MRTALLLIDGELKEKGDPREVKENFKKLAQDSSKYNLIEYWVSTHGLVRKAKGEKSAAKSSSKRSQGKSDK